MDEASSILSLFAQTFFPHSASQGSLFQWPSYVGPANHCYTFWFGMFHPELIGLIYAPSLPFPRREYWVFGHSASALNGHLCLLPPLLALWIKYTCHVTLHSTATDLWWSSGGRNCFCVGFQPTKSMSVSIFWTHPENPPPLPSEVRSGWRRQRNKETRPHCTDMEPGHLDEGQYKSLWWW